MARKNIKDTATKRLLEDAIVKNAKPSDRRYELPDGQGLFLSVVPSGQKSWTLRYRFERRQKRMNLGRYPAVSLSRARDKQKAALEDIGNGVDPVEKAKAQERERKTAPTFEALLNEFANHKKGLKGKPTATHQKRLITKDVLPVWKKRKTASITRRDAVLLIDKVRERAPVTANRLQTVLVRMFNFAAEQGIVQFSPLVGLRRTGEESRDRVLSDGEIKKFWAVLDVENKTIDMYVVTKLALKMILLSGQRPGEVCGMTWDEVQDGVWIIPDSRTKTKEVQHLPLTDMMMELLESARVYCGESRFVFTSPRSPLYHHKKSQKARPKEDDVHLSRLALSRAVLRHWEEMGFDGQRFTPHDLRRTLRTRLAELKVKPEIAERVLGHKQQGVEGIYDRHLYIAEKREALEQWQTKLREIVGIEGQDRNVLPLVR